MIAITLWIVAAVMAVAHFFEHAGTFRVMANGAQDLLLGWPMAAMLALVGAVTYGK